MSSKKPLPGEPNADKFTWKEGDLRLVSRDPNPKISLVPQESFLAKEKKELPEK